MKLLIFSHDESIMSLAQDLENLEWASCANAKEAQELVKEWREEADDELIVALLDFEVGLKSLDELSKKNIKDNWLVRIGLAPGDGLKDLRAHQKSKTAAHGYLVKPINVSALESMINDQETALFVQKNNLLDEGAEIGEIQLTKLESKALKELDGLDEDKEDYDVTHPGMVIPKSFSEETSVTSEMSFDDHSSEQAFFHDDPTHLEIQKIFDHVFGVKAKKSSPDNSKSLALPSQEELDEFLEEEEAQEEVQDEIPEEIQAEATPAPEEDVMSDHNEDDIGLEFDLSDDITGEDHQDDHGDQDEAAFEQGSSDDSEDLGFSFGEEDEGGLEIGSEDSDSVSAQAQVTEEDSEFAFDTEEEIEDLAVGGEDSADEPHAAQGSDDDGGFDLSFDDDEDQGTESLSVSADKSEFTKTVIDQDDNGMDFGDDDDDGSLNFSLGGAKNEGEVLESQTSSSDDDFGSLDFDNDDNDADPTVLGTSADLLKADPDEEDDHNNIGNDTLDKVDKTISEILLGDIRAGEGQELSDEDSTGDFDLPAGLPNELTDELNDELLAEEATGSQDFSIPAEPTNPTVVTSSAELKEGLLSQPEEDNLEEDNLEEAFSFDTTEDFNLDDVQDDVPGEEQEKTQATVIATKTISEKDLQPPLGRSLSSVSDDELMRLQATIRQLREEREEHLKEIQELKKEIKLVEQSGLSNKAELDEAKIEISILKKRHKTEIEEFRYQLKLSDERKQIFEERCKNYQKEFDRLNQKVRIEFNQVKQREKELESQLELVTMDTEAQVQARDGKILELKRKIDALEFNMENATIREQKSRDDKMRLEERLHKIMTTLRGSIKVLEDDDLSMPSLTEEQNDSEGGSKGSKDKL